MARRPDTSPQTLAVVPRLRRRRVAVRLRPLARDGNPVRDALSDPDPPQRPRLARVALGGAGERPAAAQLPAHRRGGRLRRGAACRGEAVDRIRGGGAGMKRLSRIMLRSALALLPRDGREWGEAILAELEETHGGLESLRWALGGVRVILFSPIGVRPHRGDRRRRRRCRRHVREPRGLHRGSPCRLRQLASGAALRAADGLRRSRRRRAGRAAAPSRHVGGIGVPAARRR